MAYQQIYDHLMKLIEKYLEPHAFRQVKDAAGMTSFQEDDKDYLPPSFSQRQCYVDICKEAGWIPKKKCKKKKHLQEEGGVGVDATLLPNSGRDGEIK